jgi:hypothetical protein
MIITIILRLPEPIRQPQSLLLHSHDMLDTVSLARPTNSPGAHSSTSQHPHTSPHEMSFFGLFSSSRALRVTPDAAVTQIPEPLRIYPSQQFQRTWDISKGTSTEHNHQLAMLTLETPGLTVVRVRPQLVEHEPDAVARIVASSDGAHHLDRLDVAIKHKSELRIGFKAPKAAPLPIGVLVIEIELAHASLIERIKAAAGGDVVVVEDADAAVLARRAEASLLVAFDQSRIFVVNSSTPLEFETLHLASVSGGSVILTTPQPLVVRNQLGGFVLGDGRISIQAPRVEARELLVPVVGAQGHVQILAPSEGIVVAAKADVEVWGTGSVLLHSSPLHEQAADRLACANLKIEVNGAGCVDAVAIVSNETRVGVRQGGRAVVQVRDRFTMDCEGDASSVECVGPVPAHIPSETLVVTPFEDRVWTASEPVPVAPTAVDMFTTPRVLEAKKAGFRETVRPIWSIMHGASTSNSGANAISSATTPSWVHVMSNAAGVKSLN